MKEKQTRRRYSQEFKIEAFYLVQKRGGNVTEVANSLGIHPGVLQRWLKQYSNDPEFAFPGNGKIKTSDEEFYRMQKENKELREERDILKKALTIFSKQPH